jgi:hypothetical protein
MRASGNSDLKVLGSYPLQFPLVKDQSNLVEVTSAEEKA